MTDLNSQHASILARAVELVQAFYLDHPEIKASHGWKHVNAVWEHTKRALKSFRNNTVNMQQDEWSSKVALEIQLASLLHDLDDRKYFPKQKMDSSIITLLPKKYSNAAGILEQLEITLEISEDGESIISGPTDGIKTQTTSKDRHESHSEAASGLHILQMISWVSCSENGNKVPQLVRKTGAYHWLIPRWADRLEAVGARGVVRCYQYNREQHEQKKKKGLSSEPLFSDESPRPTCEQELWSLCEAMPNRLQEYMDRGGTSTDMISHYYDKLLPVARPPKQIVQNEYLQTQADLGAQHLVEVCVRFGKSGFIDENYIHGLIDRY